MTVASIGIDLGGTKISGVVLAPGGAVLVHDRITSPRGDYAATLDAVAALVERLERCAGLPPGEAPIGVGTPGTWQPRLGCMKNCNSVWLNDRPLPRDLEARLGDRVRVANDADCFALSEARNGAGAGVDSVFGVILGTGVGGGVVVHERLVGGPNGLVGEWGHTPLPYFRHAAFAAPPEPTEAARIQLESALRDRPCYCGRVNCIETFLSGPGLAATHRELWGVEQAPEALVGTADAAALQTLEVYRNMLARSLAQVVNVLDPGVIVLGGGLSNVDSLYPALRGLVPRYAFSSTRAAGDVQVEVRRARWGDDSGVLGAARLWNGE